MREAEGEWVETEDGKIESERDTEWVERKKRYRVGSK